MKNFKNILIITLLLTSFAGFTAVLNFTPQELLEAQQKGTVIIDIRTSEEWVETGTIKDAKKIMFFNQQRKPQVEEFMAGFEKLVTTKNQPFILVCRSGSRTKAVTNFLDKKTRLYKWSTFSQRHETMDC